MGTSGAHAWAELSNVSDTHGQTDRQTDRQTDILGMPVLCGIKICGLHKHQICGGSVRKYGTELLETNYHISFHSGPDRWMVPFCWQPDGRDNEA